MEILCVIPFLKLMAMGRDKSGPYGTLCKNRTHTPILAISQAYALIWSLHLIQIPGECHLTYISDQVFIVQRSWSAAKRCTS